MINRSKDQFSPDYVAKPGDTLLETIEAIGMTQEELARRMGRPVKTINEIIKGKSRITPETALQLEKVLRIPSRFWNNLETIYRENFAKIQEKEALQQNLKWLKNIPIKEMITKGWIQRENNKLSQLKELLSFFGIAHPSQWEQIWLKTKVEFRQSKAFESDPYTVSAWLRKGEIEAQKIYCEPFNDKKFYQNLCEIRNLTNKRLNYFLTELKNLCAESGVAVVFIPEIKNIHLSGATRWLSTEKALIQLSLRYKSNDHLWFSFFHEAGHILKHGKRDIFLETSKGSEEINIKEKEANSFAQEILIPNDKWRNFIKISNLTKETIIKFALEIGVAPGIVVGRLQKEELISWDKYNDLKIRFRWSNN